MAPQKKGKKKTIQIALPASAYAASATIPAFVSKANASSKVPSFTPPPASQTNAWGKPLTHKPTLTPTPTPTPLILAPQVEKSDEAWEWQQQQTIALAIASPSVSVSVPAPGLPLAGQNPKNKKRENAFAKPVESMYDGKPRESIPSFVVTSARTIILDNIEWLKPRNQSAAQEGIYLHECHKCNFFFPGCIVTKRARQKILVMCTYCRLIDELPDSKNYKQVKVEDDECALQHHIDCGVQGHACRSSRRQILPAEVQRMVDRIKEGVKPEWVEENVKVFKGNPGGLYDDDERWWSEG